MRCEYCEEYKFYSGNTHKHRCDKQKMYFITIEKALESCPFKNIEKALKNCPLKNEVLPVGTRVYGHFGEGQIVYAGGDDCYTIKVKKSDRYIDVLSDLKRFRDDLHPLCYTLENCPDIYKPKKKKVKRYRALIWCNLQDKVAGAMAAGGDWFATEKEAEEFYAKSKCMEFIRLLKVTEKEFEE